MLQAVAKLQCLGAPGEAIDQFLLHTAVNHDAACSRAALTGGAERPPEDALGGEFHIGVRVDDDGVFAAHLKGEPLVVLGRREGDRFAGFGAAGEADYRYIAVMHEGITDITAATEDNVDHAIGNSGFLQDLGEANGELGHKRCRFDDDRVTRDKCRHHLPAGNGHREVPGCDQTHHTEWLAHAHLEFVAHFRLHRITKHAPAFARHVIGHIDGFLHVTLGLIENLAHLLSHLAGKLVLALFENLGGPEQDLATLGSGVKTPTFESFAGRGYRLVHILRRALRIRTHQLAIGRIAAFERLARNRFFPYTVDQILVEICHEMAFLSLSRCRTHCRQF